jgi:WD40 repeat protein
LWDIAHRRLAGSFVTGHTYGVTSIAFSPDGALLASGSYDGTIRLWRLAHSGRSGSHVQAHLIGAPLSGHTGGVTSVRFSPDGTILASGSQDGTIRLWDVAHQQPLGSPLTGHTASVYGVAFSPNGALLASGSDDATIRLWDVARRQPLGLPLTGHSGSVYSVAFSPDGKLLASGSYDHTVRLWDVDIASWKRQACDIANRNLTQQEWQQYVGDHQYRKTCPTVA